MSVESASDISESVYGTFGSVASTPSVTEVGESGSEGVGVVVGTGDGLSEGPNGVGRGDFVEEISGSSFFLIS